MRRTVIALTVALMALGLLAGPALAAANPTASCIGIGSSAAGPSGERDDIAHFVKAGAEEEGIPTGHIYSFFAKQHLGSEEACFEEE